jgi:retron-type reverse transcriptase
MTFNPCRRRGRHGVAGARARQKPADLHEGSREDFLRRHELEAATAARGDSMAKLDFVAKLSPRTADSRNLRVAWDHLASGDGQAPGIDGLRFDELEDAEIWNLTRVLHEAILTDRYRTDEDRIITIPKASGRGFRMLTIPTIIDRVVQRAIVQTTQPYLDVFFDDFSFGFRPNVDVYTALATAKNRIVENDAWVLLTEDLKDAFNHVPQRRLFDILRILIPDDGMMRLIERVMQTKTGRGLRQGGNLSPLLLNVYLNHCLDRPWNKLHPDVTLIRWADDLLVLCRSVEEAQQAYQDLTRLLLPTGMRMKSSPEKAVCNLGNGSHVDWLGYRLAKEGDEVKVYLTDKAWTSLQDKLELDHTKVGSPLRAVETIKGWVSQMGPCYEQTNMTRAYARIVAMAHELAFDELPSKEEMSRTWRVAHLRWRRTRTKARRMDV